MNISDKEELCCGCGACAEVCPHKAIIMKKDTKGFNIPIVNYEKCVKCEICHRVCPANAKKSFIAYSQKIYAIKLVDIEKRLQSQSGGGFTALAECILADGGVVYGVSFLQKDYEAKYIKISLIEDLSKLKGSKYVQASVGNVFNMVKNDLNNNRKVLFSGTACHIHGLLNYLEQIKTMGSNNLYTCDLICHGVPSPQILKDYLIYLESKNKGIVKNFNFRDKEVGWHEHLESYHDSNNKKIYGRIYTDLFYSHLTFRESCYKCQYSSFNRMADITLGDFWGIENSYPEFDDNKGISVVMINSDHGNQLFQKASGKMNILNSERKSCIQPNLVKSSYRPQNTDIFWKQYKEEGFLYIAKKYTSLNWRRRLKSTVKLVIKKIFEMVTGD